jgi:hypothetical protein
VWRYKLEVVIIFFKFVICLIIFDAGLRSVKNIEKHLFLR